MSTKRSYNIDEAIQFVMEPFSDSELSDIADSDGGEYVPQLEEMVGGKEIKCEEELEHETDVKASAGKPDDAGEDDKDGVAKDKEPAAEFEKSARRMYSWR